MARICRYLVLMATAALFGSCESPDHQGDLSVSVTSDMVCRTNQVLKTNDPAPETSCIRFDYDGTSLLTLKHLNAGFNCCPGKFDVSIEVKGDSLIIREDENQQGCKCNCLFNLDILVGNLSPAAYHVRFVEPYADYSIPQLIFDLNLKKVPNGQFCVTRPEGWWY